jgi:hypothetical protein
MVFIIGTDYRALTTGISLTAKKAQCFQLEKALPDEY